MRVVSDAPGIGTIGRFDEAVVRMYDVLISANSPSVLLAKAQSLQHGSQLKALVVTGSGLTVDCARTTPVIADNAAQNKHSERDIVKTRERQAKIDKSKRLILSQHTYSMSLCSWRAGDMRSGVKVVARSRGVEV